MYYIVSIPDCNFGKGLHKIQPMGSEANESPWRFNTLFWGWRNGPLVLGAKLSAKRYVLSQVRICKKAIYKIWIIKKKISFSWILSLNYFFSRIYLICISENDFVNNKIAVSSLIYFQLCSQCPHWAGCLTTAAASSAEDDLSS